MHHMIQRAAQAKLQEVASWMRIAIVSGPRQAGKTTLLRQYQSDHGGTFITLDDQQILEQVLNDPVTFAQSGARPLLIDEVQRGGDHLVRAIKLAVDENQERNQFVLAGSTQFLAIPTLSESLAGRVGFINLWGLSVAERCGYTGNFCDLAFNDPAAFVDSNSHWQRKDYIKAVIQGGYPELLPMPATANARHTWFTGYLTTIVERDISSFAEIERISALQAILKLVAARAGSLVVQSDLARSLQFNRETVRNYLGYLELVFLLATIPSWSNNLSSRIARTPKTYVTDSGLAAHLLGVEAQALATPGHSALGGLLETFVLSEIMKLQSVADTPFEIHHYRERDDREID
ncbi:MAG: ATP-binding protein, partial [Candidatus Dormibacteraceae bacterium]